MVGEETTNDEVAAARATPSQRAFRYPHRTVSLMTMAGFDPVAPGSTPWLAYECNSVGEIEMEGNRKVREEGARFGIIMACIAVVLAVGAIWFALSR